MGLCHWITRRGANYGDPQRDYGKIISATMVTLLRAFGNAEKTTDALLTSHFLDLLHKTNLVNECDVRCLSIIAFICMGTYRPNSIKHMMLQDLQFTITEVEGTTDYPLAQLKISCKVTMKKDKHLLMKDHENMLTSGPDLKNDFMIAFLIYQWDFRKIGTQSTLAAALLKRDLSIKEEYLNTPLFVKTGTKNTLLDDFWDPLQRFGIRMQCSVKVTPRACRANGPTQGCLTKIYETMKAPSNSLLIQLMEQGNWESLQSMKPYKKAAVRLALPATHYSSTTIRPTATHDDRLQQHREEMIKNGYVVIMVPTVATRDFTTVEE